MCVCICTTHHLRLATGREEVLLLSAPRTATGVALNLWKLLSCPQAAEGRQKGTEVQGFWLYQVFFFLLSAISKSWVEVPERATGRESRQWWLRGSAEVVWTCLKQLSAEEEERGREGKRNDAERGWCHQKDHKQRLKKAAGNFRRIFHPIYKPTAR